MAEQLTLTEEAFALTIIDGESLQLTLDGGNGPAGPAGPNGTNGAAGAAGPNTITTSTTAPSLNGYIFGNGTNIAGATAATSDPTPSTLVLRDANGGARFGDVETYTITASGIVTTGHVEFNGTDAGDSLTFNMVNYIYGADAAEAHRTALGLATAATAATPSTLVLRNGSGGASLAGLTLSGTGGSPYTSTLTGGVNFDNRTLVLPDASGTLVVSSQLANSASITASNAVAVNTIVLRDSAGKILISNVDVSGATTYASSASWAYTTPSAATHRTALGSGATGDALFQALTPTAARETLGVRTFTKPTNESRAINTTYTADSHLKDIPLESGKSYKIDFFLAAYVPGPTAPNEGGKARLVVPLASGTVPIQCGIRTTSQWGNGSSAAIDQTTSGSVRFMVLAASGGYNANRVVTGTAYTGILSASGVLSLEWAQNTSGANATIMLGGSVITITEL